MYFPWAENKVESASSGSFLDACRTRESTSRPGSLPSSTPDSPVQPSSMAQETKVADVLPHGKLREVFPNVWVVTGTAAMGGGKMIIPRNMTVIREGTDLTLISAIRLKDEDLTELEKLGCVRVCARGRVRAGSGLVVRS